MNKLIPKILITLILFIPLSILAFQTELDSEIEKEVRDALINSYTSKELLVDDTIKKFEHYDANLFIHYGFISGLKDNITELRNNLIKDRDDFIDAKKTSLRSLDAKNIDKVQNSMIHHSLYNDEYNLIRRLTYEDRFNRSYIFFNMISQTASRVLLGQTEAFLQFLTDSIFFFDRITRLTIHENKIAHLTKRFKSKHPDSKHNLSLQKKLNKIEKKQKKNLFKTELLKGDYFLSKEDFGNAINCYQYALSLFPDSRKANRKTLKAEKKVTKLMRERYKSLIVINGEDRIRNTKEEEAYKELLLAATLRDPDIIEHIANNFFRIYTRSSVSDEAEYLLAIAYNIRGDRNKAIKRFERLANQEKYSNMREHSKMILKNPEYNPYSAFLEENKQFKKDTMRYVLTGHRPFKTSLHLTLSSVAYQQVRAVGNLSVFFLLDMGIRAIAINFKNPLELDNLAFLANRTLQKTVNENKKDNLVDIMAKRDERAGNYHKAIEYLKLSSFDYSIKIKKLEGKLAKNIYVYAKETEDTSEKERALKFLVEKFPSSKYYDLAQEQLKKLSIPSETDIIINKKLLQENLILSASENLDISPDLFDGYKENNELLKDGVIIDSHNNMTMKINRYKQGTFTIKRPIDEEKRTRIVEMYNNIIKNKDLEAIKLTQFKTRVPIEVTGGIGESGISFYPRLGEVKLKKEEEELYK